MFLRHTHPYRHDSLKVRVRDSRGADFSGSCFYRDARLFINLGRRVAYPYTFGTHLARAEGLPGGWKREVYRLTVADAYQLALFVYLHELFHYLVMAAGRNTRRKEGMCDRFAAGTLVEAYGCPVTDSRGVAVDSRSWKFQDLHAFVAGAPREPCETIVAARRDIPVRIRGIG